MKKGEEFISQIDKNRALVKYLWRIIVVLVILLIVLSFSFLSIKDTVKVKVELPAKFTYKYAPVVVAGIDGANKIYYKLWGKYIVNDLANFTPNNITSKIDTIRKMMPPDVAIRKDKELKKFATNLALNLIHQSFAITDIKISNIKNVNDLVKSATINIKGIAKQKIGKKSIDKTCSYKIKFNFIEGVLYVENFGTDCF